MNYEILLKVAAVLHLGLIAAGATMPHTVRLREHLSRLPEFIRRLFWVYYTFIGFVLISFGTLTWLLAAAMVEGGLAGRLLAGVMALFWIMRLIVGGFVLNERPYLTNWCYRLGFYGINAIFVYFAVLYTMTAAFGGDL